MWQERTDDSWTIEWFDDDRIIQFFKDNALPEFPNIIDVFHSFKDGGHKADLFRYYYLYLNGGFFIDSDLMTHVHMNQIYSAEHDLILVFSDISCNRQHHPEIKSPIIFNGLMGCLPKNQIIYDALVNAYRTKPRLLDKQRLYFVYMLYVFSEKYRSKYKIKYFYENISHANDVIANIVDANDTAIASHYFGNKVIPKKSNKQTTYVTTFNKAGYDLYGRTWVKTFVGKTAGSTAKAKIYCEGFKPDFVSSDRVEFVDFNKELPEHVLWKKQYLLLTEHLKYTKNMTVRFSHKAFVVTHALENLQSDYVVWLDGDCVFTGYDYDTFAEDILDNKFLACQIEINKISGVHHVESGVLVFDNKHQEKQKYIDTFKEFYSVNNIINMPNDYVDTNEPAKWKDYGPYDGFITHKTIAATQVSVVDLNIDGEVDSFVGYPELTFKHPELSKRFVHNIGHAGKNNYPKINQELKVENAITEGWSNEATDKMNDLSLIISRKN
jgi:hypothetical protein